MSEQVLERAPAPADLPGFFGAHEPLPREDVDPAIWPFIDRWVATHRGGRERLIPLLHAIQEQLGYLPFPVQEYVAEKLGLSPIQVYGVVSFYHFFTTTPRGRYQLKVCMGTACFVRHAQSIVETLNDVLGIGVGEVTEDRMFSLEQVRCIGACGLAPAMMVNDEVHGNLTRNDVRRLVRRLRAKERKAAAKAAGEADGGTDEQ